MTTYLGMPVLEVEPNRRTPFSDSYSLETDTLDSPVGLWYRDISRQHPTIAVEGLSFLCESREEWAEFRTFFDAQTGQLKPFWMPSWNFDFTLALDVGGSDLAITVLETGYVEWGFSSVLDVRKHLALSYMASGSRQWQYREIISAANSGSREVLGLSSSLGTGYTTDQLDVSFLRYVRFASDSLHTVWHTTEVCEVSTAVIEIPAEVAT